MGKMNEEALNFLRKNNLLARDILCYKENEEEKYVRILADGRLRSIWPIGKVGDCIHFANSCTFYENFDILKTIKDNDITIIRREKIWGKLKSLVF